MNKQNILFKGVVVLVLGLNLIIRVWGLEVSPTSINWDEASIGYNAYSILTTGRDEYGTYLPLSLRSFNDYKPALYAYLSIPFIKLMGLSQTSVRMVSVVAGTLSLIPLLLFINILLKKKWWSFLIWMFYCLDPLRLHFSRVSLETNLSMSFFSFGAWYLLKDKLANGYTASKNMILATIFLALSAYSYHSARLAVPLLMIFVLIDPFKYLLNKNKIDWKFLLNLKYILLFLILILPIFNDFGSQKILTRFTQENIFNKFYPFTPRNMYKYDLNTFLRVNPLYYLTGIIAGHTAAYFSPANYSINFYHWIKNSVMYVPEFNMLGFWNSILLVPGIYILLKNFRNTNYRLVFYWVAAALMPSAITWNWFHTLRSANLIPAVEIISILPIIYLIKLNYSKKRLTVMFGLLVLFGWQSIFVINNELVYANYENQGEYQPGGFKEGTPIISSLIDKYQKIIIDTPHAQGYIFFLFYQMMDPEIIQSIAKNRTYGMDNGNSEIKFGKYEFRKIDWPKDRDLSNTILWMPATTPQEAIDNRPGAKAIFLKGPTIKYNSAMIVTLD